MENLFFLKYRKSDGLVINQNYYSEFPIENDDFAYTNLLPTENFISMHYDSGANKYYEGATAQQIEQHTIENAIKVVSRRQLKLALLLNGIESLVIDELIAGLPEQDKAFASIVWKEAITFERTDPLLITLASAIGLNDLQLANLFIQASEL